MAISHAKLFWCLLFWRVQTTLPVRKYGSRLLVVVDFEIEYSCATWVLAAMLSLDSITAGFGCNWFTLTWLSNDFIF